MASFDAAFAVVYAHEVGPGNQGFANHPLDPGGPTNWGISQPTYSAWLKRPATIEDMKAMTIDVAKMIYRVSYWGIIKGDGIKSEALAANFMDMAVLRGVVAASKTMQSCVGVLADGFVGPKTLAAIESQNPGVLVIDYFTASQKALAGLVTAKPEKVVFLDTWMRRVADMLQPISASMRQPSKAAA